MTTEATCQHCGKSFTPPGRGRLPRYCCPAHRQAAWQARRRPTIGQEHRQAGGAVTTELEALRAQVVALLERVERLEADADDGEDDRD